MWGGDAFSLKKSWPDFSNTFKVLDLPTSAVNTTPPSSNRAPDCYKAAGDGGELQQGGALAEPSVHEAQTRSLQQLLGSATTLTAKEELLRTLRLAPPVTRQGGGL